jgi:DNA-binding HxlR family transcriptional regulator
MKTYGQYCPIARTSELFAERWTPIVVRNLAAGCRTFSQLRQGAPGIPKALLAERLALLERYGVVARLPQPSKRGSFFELTESGRDLKRVCDVMGAWGARWLEIEPHHLDPAYVLWATCRLVDIEQVPPPVVVVRFDLRDQPKRRFWMLLQRPRAELCTAYPGRCEDLIVTTDSATLVQWNLRRIDFHQALRTGYVQVDGPPGLARAFPTWMRPSPFAHVAPAGRPGAKTLEPALRTQAAGAKRPRNSATRNSLQP